MNRIMKRLRDKAKSRGRQANKGKEDEQERPSAVMSIVATSSNSTQIAFVEEVKNNNTLAATPLKAVPNAANKIPNNSTTDNTKSLEALQKLKRFLANCKSIQDFDSKLLQQEPFASAALTLPECEKAQAMLWQHYRQVIRQDRAAELQGIYVSWQRPNGTSIQMKYWSRVYYPASNYPVSNKQRKSTSATNDDNNAEIPLFIGMHGGGGCPAKVNDRQWKNHQVLYDKTFQQLANTSQLPLLYIAPRAPTDTWNLWHQLPHMDPLLDRLIQNHVVAGVPQSSSSATKPSYQIDSNRVYIFGYSAGGDGVYKLAPRMADRWAAASMMAGHPNGVSLRGVANVPFSLHVGGKDGAYQRNKVARQYKTQLETWQQEQQTKKQQAQKTLHNNGSDNHRTHIKDEDLFQNIWAKVYEKHGHGLQNKDAAAIPWMAQFTRNTNPCAVLWDQSSSRHERFYWILRDTLPGKMQGEMKVMRSGQTITIDISQCQNAASILKSLTLRFNDSMIDLDQLINIFLMECDDNDGHSDRDHQPKLRLLQAVKLSRTIGVLARTLEERSDPHAMYSSEIKVDLLVEPQ